MMWREPVPVLTMTIIDLFGFPPPSSGIHGQNISLASLGEISYPFSSRTFRAFRRGKARRNAVRRDGSLLRMVAKWCELGVSEKSFASAGSFAILGG